MPQKINAQRFTISPRTVFEVPVYSKFLDVQLDPAQNQALVWYIGDFSEEVKREKVEIIMLQLDGELVPQSAKYIGMFKANQGAVFVFASRTSDNPLTVVPHVFPTT